VKWLRTAGGIEFLVAGDRFVFLELRGEFGECRVAHCCREGDTLDARCVSSGDPYWGAVLLAETFARRYAMTAPAALLDDSTAIAQASALLDRPTGTEENETA
jgi:hypothetical protein